ARCSAHRGSQADSSPGRYWLRHFPWPSVVQNRAAHDLHGLLRRVAGRFVFGRSLSSERIQVSYLPHGGLRTIAAPVTRLAFPHRIPARLVAPVVSASRDCEVLLHPDDLGSDLEAAVLQARATSAA